MTIYVGTCKQHHETWGSPPTTCDDCGEPIIAVAISVSPEVARLIEAVGADNLPALLRVADMAQDMPGQSQFPEWRAALRAVPDGTWERLGKALDGGA